MCTSPLTSLPCWKWDCKYLSFAQPNMMDTRVLSMVLLLYYPCLIGVRCFLNQTLAIATLYVLSILCSVYQCEVPQHMCTQSWAEMHVKKQYADYDASCTDVKHPSYQNNSGIDCKINCVIIRNITCAESIVSWIPYFTGMTLVSWVLQNKDICSCILNIHSDCNRTFSIPKMINSTPSIAPTKCRFQVEHGIGLDSV